jgi:hypothetical protein
MCGNPCSWLANVVPEARAPFNLHASDEIDWLKLTSA